MLIGAYDDVILPARCRFDSIDGVIEEVLADVELVIVGYGGFFAFGVLIADDVHDVSGNICRTQDCSNGPICTWDWNGHMILASIIWRVGVYDVAGGMTVGIRLCKHGHGYASDDMFESSHDGEVDECGKWKD